VVAIEFFDQLSWLLTVSFLSIFQAHVKLSSYWRRPIKDLS